jgi:hypothetical protein
VKHRPPFLLLPSSASLALLVIAAPAAAEEPVPAAPAQAAPGLIVAPAPAELNSAPELPAPPPPAAEDLGKIDIHAWGRADVVLGNGKKLDDIGSDGVIELHASGKVHKYFTLTGNLVGAYGGSDGISGNAHVLDAIVQFEPCDEFHLWMGRNLVPVDRSNFSGPWFMAPWNYPGFGFADGQVGAPREGPSGRNDGVTAWGFAAGGLIKYYIGAYDLYDRSQSPLISGRINLSLLSPEPGFYSNSTYYGKDLLALGGGFQTKKNSSTAPVDPADPTGPVFASNYTEFNADLLFEKTLPGGVVDLEGAYYDFIGNHERTKSSWFGVASYLFTDVGIQPLLRVQQAIPKADGADTATLVDAQLGYVLNGFATRFALGYQYGKAGDLKTQAIFLGAQLMK